MTITATAVFICHVIIIIQYCGISVAYIFMAYTKVNFVYFSHFCILIPI